MKSFFTAAAVAGVLAFAATTAQAAVYSFGGSDANSGSFVVSAAGGPNLTVTSGQRSGSSVVASNGYVARRSDGMGAGYRGDSDPSQVDGFGRDEVLVLNFGSAVQLIGATFSRFGSNDDFTLWFDSGADGVLGSGDRVGQSGSNPITFSGTYIGTLFGFGAEGNNDEWRLRSVEANAISAVPVPAALPLFGAALLGMGFLARRRKQKAALQA